jgi:hypothetical protein
LNVVIAAYDYDTTTFIIFSAHAKMSSSSPVPRGVSASTSSPDHVVLNMVDDDDGMQHTGQIVYRSLPGNDYNDKADGGGTHPGELVQFPLNQASSSNRSSQSPTPSPSSAPLSPNADSSSSSGNANDRHSPVSIGGGHNIGGYGPNSSRYEFLFNKGPTQTFDRENEKIEKLKKKRERKNKEKNVKSVSQEGSKNDTYDINKVLKELGDGLLDDGGAAGSGKKAARKTKSTGSNNNTSANSTNGDMSAVIKIKVSKKKSTGKDNSEAAKKAKVSSSAYAAADKDDEEEEEEDEEAAVAAEAEAAVKDSKSDAATAAAAATSTPSFFPVASSNSSNVQYDASSSVGLASVSNRSVSPEFEMDRAEVYDLRRQTSRSTENLSFTTVTKKKWKKKTPVSMDENSLDSGNNNAHNYNSNNGYYGQHSSKFHYEPRHGGGSYNVRNNRGGGNNAVNGAAPSSLNSEFGNNHSNGHQPPHHHPHQQPPHYHHQTQVEQPSSLSSRSSTTGASTRSSPPESVVSMPQSTRSQVQAAATQDLDLQADFPPLGPEADDVESSATDADGSVNCWRPMSSSAIAASSSTTTPESDDAVASAQNEVEKSDSQAVIEKHGATLGTTMTAAAAAEIFQDDTSEGHGLQQSDDFGFTTTTTTTDLMNAASSSPGASLCGPPDITTQAHSQPDNNSARPPLPDIASQAPLFAGTGSSGEDTPPGAVVALSPPVASAEADKQKEEPSEAAVEVVVTEADYNRERESSAPIVILGKGEDWAPTTDGLEFGFDLNEDLLYSPCDGGKLTLNGHPDANPAQTPLDREDGAILSFGESTFEQKGYEDVQQHPLPAPPTLAAPIGGGAAGPVANFAHHMSEASSEAAPCQLQPPPPLVYDPSFLEIVCYVAAKWQEVCHEMKAKKDNVIYFQLKGTV